MADIFYTTKEAARILKHAPQTLNNWRHRGYGPAFRKHGRTVVYEHNDLMQWSESRRVQNTQQAERVD
jgi:hypothetical protein